MPQVEAALAGRWGSLVPGGRGAGWKARLPSVMAPSELLSVSALVLSPRNRGGSGASSKLFRMENDEIFLESRLSQALVGTADKGKPEPCGQAGGRAAGDLRRLSMTRSWEAAPEPWRARCPGAALVGAGSGRLSYASVLSPPTVYAQPSNQRDAVTTKSVPISPPNQGQSAYCD